MYVGLYYSFEMIIINPYEELYHSKKALGIQILHKRFNSDDNDDEVGKLLWDVQYVVGSWGMQRNLGEKEKFYINWSIGSGVKTNWKDYAEFSLVGQLGLGLQW